MVLWIHPEDLARVRREIVAIIPAEYDPVSNSFIEPDPATALPHQLDLVRHALRRQMHVCKDIFKPGCRCKGWCKYGAPWETHMEHEPRMNVITKRYNYYR